MSPRAGRLAAAGLAAALLLPAVLVAAGQGQTGPTAEVPALAALLAAGEEAYAWNCAVCHGATGGGLVEARLAFPADEQRCTRCHRPSNPAVHPLDQPFKDNDMFSIGEPPALHPTPERPAPLAAVVAPEALIEYLVLTMPRYDPGRLSADEYRAVAAFLLAMNGRQQEAAALAAAYQD